MKKIKRYTVNDVAKAAGTSITTVSRVMNSSKYPVSEELRQKVMSIAAEMNYFPNAAQKKSQCPILNEIGVIIPTISNPFYASSILGIQQEIQKYGYNILLCDTSRSEEKEREYLHMLYNKHVKGVIISAVARDGQNVAYYVEKGMNVILLDQQIDGVKCDNILFDYREGARIATDYLINSGHRKIAYITAPMTKWTRREIFNGYCSALRHNADFTQEPILFEAADEQEENESTYESIIGKMLADQFIKSKCDATAVLCVNDMVAFGFIQGLEENGVKVPDNVSVIGIDDIPFSSIFIPALTTVKSFAYEMGCFAGRMLIDRANGNEPLETSLKFGPKLIERSSVKKINVASF